MVALEAQITEVRSTEAAGVIERIQSLMAESRSTRW
jgi:hypothetical protein